MFRGCKKVRNHEMEHGASNKHSTLRGNIKSKKTTTNNGDGRDSVNVPNRHLYGTCLVVHSWANCTERGL
jgi:hypothetical protein